MSLGTFKGIDFTFPDGTTGIVDNLKVSHDMHVMTSEGERRIIRSTVTIVNNDPEVADGRAENPDLRITGKRMAVYELLIADDLPSKINELVDEGRISLELIAPMEDLAAMGFKGIYDELSVDG